MNKVGKTSDVWVHRILSALDNLKYGTVEIVVHEDRIVQINRVERNRFDHEKA
ncbi:YezD family protein [Alicyclobacillus fodiniaquatilis]|jgi:hypothetical protein|uniref:YezD family protein n=1 Tax=Alicyclobacillus fodiniaquatilis TaxID=1661150 RepID=A0ABW4JMR5_9BACL